MLINAPAAAPAGKRIGSTIVGPNDQWSAQTPHGLTQGGAFSLYHDSPQPLKILKLEPGGEAFAVTLNTLEEGKSYSVNFSSRDNLPLGLHQQTITVQTDSKETPELKLTLALGVVPPVSVNPAKINFESIPVSLEDYDISTLSKFTWVQMRRGDGFEIKNMTCDLPFIKVKIESVEANKLTYLLRIGFNAKPPKGKHQGLLKIETNNKDAPLIEVPIMVNAQ
jgi:hypothetical protein